MSSSVHAGLTCGSFGGASYIGELPSSTLKYGTWIINKRNIGSISIQCLDIDDNTIWTNTYANAAWKGWVSCVKNSDLSMLGGIQSLAFTKIDAKRVLLYAYTDSAKNNGFRIDFNGNAAANHIIFSDLTNGSANEIFRK